MARQASFDSHFIVEREEGEKIFFPNENKIFDFLESSRFLWFFSNGFADIWVKRSEKHSENSKKLVIPALNLSDTRSDLGLFKGLTFNADSVISTSDLLLWP
jgi:hypothetical protein